MSFLSLLLRKFLTHLEGEEVLSIFIESFELEISILESRWADCESLSWLEYHLKNGELDEEEGSNAKHSYYNNTISIVELKCQEIDAFQENQQYVKWYHYVTFIVREVVIGTFVDGPLDQTDGVCI